MPSPPPHAEPRPSSKSVTVVADERERDEDAPDGLREEGPRGGEPAAPRKTRAPAAPKAGEGPR